VLTSVKLRQRSLLHAQAASEVVSAELKKLLADYAWALGQLSDRAERDEARGVVQQAEADAD